MLSYVAQQIPDRCSFPGVGLRDRRAHSSGISIREPAVSYCYFRLHRELGQASLLFGATSKVRNLGLDPMHHRWPSNSKALHASFNGEHTSDLVQDGLNVRRVIAQTIAVTMNGGGDSPLSSRSARQSISGDSQILGDKTGDFFRSIFERGIAPFGHRDLEIQWELCPDFQGRRYSLRQRAFGEDTAILSNATA